MTMAIDARLLDAHHAVLVVFCELMNKEKDRHIESKFSTAEQIHERIKQGYYACKNITIEDVQSAIDFAEENDGVFKTSNGLY